MKIKVIDEHSGISAEVVAHSTSPEGKEILTVNVKYGLFVHAEFLRHRSLSRGVKSNRAIPTKAIRKEVLECPYIPVFLGKNKPGMRSDEEIYYKDIGRAIYKVARYPVVLSHWVLEKLGAHKEWTNRLLSPWQWVRETITATEWENVLALRLHNAAQRDIRAVVQCIKSAAEISRANGNVEMLRPGEWHTPYLRHSRVGGVLQYVDNDGRILSVVEALEASAARCARSSYDKHDGVATTWENDKKLFDSLVKDEPKHASPTEHQATPMTEPSQLDNYLWQDGVTHVDREGNLWSGNFRGFLQHRQLIPNNVKKG